MTLYKPKKLINIFGLMTTILCITSCIDTKQETTISTSPNVIIIFTDDQGYQDVGCFGSPDIATPHIDQMAKEGARLTDFHAAQPICTASRAALLTGCYPNRLGVHAAFMPNCKKGLNREETTIAKMLKNKGYATGIFGKWHLGDDDRFNPLNYGFDEFFGLRFSNDMWPQNPKTKEFHFDPLQLLHNREVIDTLTDQSTLTTQITEKSIEFIKKNKENQFFLYVAHPQPHVPLFVSDKFKGKSKRGLYGDVIMELDWSVGQILSTLKSLEIDHNTLVVFTSDNGPWLSYGDHAGSATPLREGKGTIWEGGHREPCIAWYPGAIQAGIEINTTLMNIDILPTIAELTDAQLPSKKIDGKSALDVLLGKTDQSPQNAYFYYYNENDLQGVRYKNWKLHFPHAYRSLNQRVAPSDGTSISYDLNKLDNIALYDLTTDIGETKNVALEHKDIVDTIVTLANEMRQDLGDDVLGISGTGRRPIEKIN